MSTEYKKGIPNINLIKNHTSKKWEYTYNKKDKNPGYVILNIEDGTIVAKNGGCTETSYNNISPNSFNNYLLRPVKEDRKVVDWEDIEYIKNLPNIEDVKAHEKNGAHWAFKNSSGIEGVYLFAENGEITASWSQDGKRKFEPTKNLGWHDVSYCPRKDDITSWDLIKQEIVMNKTIPSVEVVDKHFKENGGRWDITNGGFVYLRAVNGKIECSINSGRTWDEIAFLTDSNQKLTAVKKDGAAVNTRKGFPDKEIIKAHEAAGGLWNLNGQTLEFKIINDVINIKMSSGFEPAIPRWGNYNWCPVDKNKNEVPWPEIYKKGLPREGLIRFHEKSGGEWSFKEKRYGVDAFHEIKSLYLKYENDKALYSLNNNTWYSVLNNNIGHDFNLDEYVPMKSGKIISWTELEDEFKKSKEINMPVVSSNIAAIIPTPFETMPSYDSYEKKEEKITTKIAKPAIKKDSPPTIIEKIAIRTGAKQLTKRGQELIINLMTKHLKGKEKTKAVISLQEALSSPMGYCLVGLVLSTIVKEAPTLYKTMSGKEFKSSRLDALVDELRIEGASEVGSMLVDLLTNIGSLNLIQEEPKEKLEIPLVAEELTPA